jgi:two-component system nitrogen regulation sensor histidine kinase NtrY
LFSRLFFLTRSRIDAMSLIRRISAALSPESDPVALRAEIGRLTQALGADADERRQREELLQTIVDGTPAALVLVGETGKIAFTNPSARQLFFDGRDARGDNFLLMLGNVTEPLRRALLSESDQIFTFEEAGETETYHLAKSHFVLDGEPHTLISVRHVTLEVSKQEIVVLKKTLRIIGHELANSMAPASSLLRSIRLMLEKLGTPELHTKIVSALQTVEERLQHLHGFLLGLAHLGQLPRPQKREVDWPTFIGGLRALWSDVAIGGPPAAVGWLDPTQIQQVLINLVKNAHESGGPRDGVSLEVDAAADGGVRFAVLDRGPGMSDDVLNKALIPAFTTKANGSGMGLALCREIVEAHDGRLRIGRRPDGTGTIVSFWLPPRVAEQALSSRARLTLTGGR